MQLHDIILVVLPCKWNPGSRTFEWYWLFPRNLHDEFGIFVNFFYFGNYKNWKGQCYFNVSYVFQVQLEHDHISEYVIRTQPNSKSLCTIEAIALSLSVLENNDEVAEVRISVSGIFYDIVNPCTDCLRWLPSFLRIFEIRCFLLPLAQLQAASLLSLTMQDCCPCFSCSCTHACPWLNVKQKRDSQSNVGHLG